MGNQPYPAYKPSGIEWLGDIPAHWEIRRLKSVAANVIDLTREMGCDDIYLALEHVEGWTGKYEGESVGATFSSQVKRFNDGDVLFGKLRPYLAKVARPNQNGVCVGEFLVFRPRDCTLSPDYLEYSLRSKPAIDDINASTFGAKMPRADWSFIGDMRFPLPPLPEQRAIAQYLDLTDDRIQRYIAAKERLVQSLTEYRQALINQAVTRGLDPNIPLEPSGIDWLGDVPAHWEIRRLGYLATKFGSGVTPRGGAINYQESGVPFLRSQNIHFDGLRIQDVARIPTSLHEELSGSHVKPGDVLLNITGASIGRVCSIPNDFAEGNVNQHVCIIRQGEIRLHPNLLAAYLSTPMMQRQIQFNQSGASREGLTLQSIRGFKVLVPPPAEQAAIVCHLDEKTATIDRQIENARRQIELMREYRARLIADVVTGKIDVRAATVSEDAGLEGRDRDDYAG